MSLKLQQRFTRAGLCALVLLAGSNYAARAQSLQDATSSGTSVTVDTSGLGTSISGSNLVNNNPSSFILLNSNGTATIDLGSAQVIKGYSLTDDPSNAAFNPTNWTLQGSNTAGSGYVNLDSRTGNTWEMLGSRKFFAVSNNTAYRYYRLVNNGGAAIHIAEAELFQDFSITGTVFQDFNLNNIKDGAEPAVVGTKVWLKQLTSASPLVTLPTDANGAYQFTSGQLDGLERFAVIVQPQGNLLPRTEPLAFDWPRTMADGAFVFANETPLQFNTSPYQKNGVLNFGFLPASISYVTDTIASNPNLITNENGGSFGTIDSTGNAFANLHINGRLYDYLLSASHPELYSPTVDYTVGSSYAFYMGPLYSPSSYTVTSMLGTTTIETGDNGNGRLTVQSSALNFTNWGWRYSAGATTGAWNDRFMAIDGNNAAGIGTNVNIFADTVNLLAGNNYSFGLYGKGANKWFQGSVYAVATKLRYTLVNIGNGDTAATGYLVIQPTTGDATDSINLGWNKVVSNFSVLSSGDYGVYYQTYANGTAGNDAYLDNFFLRKASYQITGKIYNDANGLTNNAVDGTPINTLGSTPLYVYLIDPVTNQIVGVSPVAPDGSYTLVAPDFKNYLVAPSTQVLDPGATFNPANALPTGWSPTGSNTGQNNTTGTNVTGTSTSVNVFPVVPSSDVTNVNFGFERLPESYNATKTVTGPPVIGAPINLSDVPMQGSDPEDNGGVQAPLNGKPVIVTAAPTNGFVLKYNGVTINPGDTIPNYNPALLTITPTASTPIGTTTTSFQFASIDLAGKADPSPASYTVNFSQPLPVTLGAFTAVVDNHCAVRLDWTTLKEEQLKNIQVERSENGKAFSPIASITPRGTGFAYNYTDQALSKGRYTYRLRFNDHDTRYSYSGVQLVAISCAADIQVFPTETKDKVMIQGIGNQTTVTVSDVSGRKVLETTGNGPQMTLSLQTLTPSVYFITVYTGTTPVVQVKVVKQ